MPSVRVPLSRVVGWHRYALCAVCVAWLLLLWLRNPTVWPFVTPLRRLFPFSRSLFSHQIANAPHSHLKILYDIIESETAAKFTTAGRRCAASQFYLRYCNASSVCVCKRVYAYIG